MLLGAYERHRANPSFDLSGRSREVRQLLPRSRIQKIDPDCAAYT